MKIKNLFNPFVLIRAWDNEKQYLHHDVFLNGNGTIRVREGHDKYYCMEQPKNQERFIIEFGIVDSGNEYYSGDILKYEHHGLWVFDFNFPEFMMWRPEKDGTRDGIPFFSYAWDETPTVIGDIHRHYNLLEDL